MSDLLGVFQEVVLCEEKKKTLRIFSCVQMTVNTCRHFRGKSMIYFLIMNGCHEFRFYSRSKKTLGVGI